MNNLVACEVVLENSAAVYVSNQTVVGNVVLALTDSVKLRKLQLTFVGKASVYWTEGNGQQTRSHSAKEVYFDESLVLLESDDDDEVILAAGSYKFPFSYILPAYLPSSFEGAHGRVRYKAKVVIEKRWKRDHVTRRVFAVLNCLDLNREPMHLLMPHEIEVVKDVLCCCLEPGSITAKLTVNRRCFVPGETIVMSSVIKNDSYDKRWENDKTRISLQQKVDYRTESSVHTWSRTIGKVVNSAPVPCGETLVWNDIAIQVPQLAPSRLDGCSIIDVTYLLILKSIYGVKVSMEITIGTIPLYSVLSSNSVITSQPQSLFAVSEIDQTANAVIAPPPSYEESCSGQALDANHDSTFTPYRRC